MVSFKNSEDGNCNDTAEGCGCSGPASEGVGTESRRTVVKSFLLAAFAFKGLVSARSALADTAALPDEEKRKLPPQVGDRLTYFSKRRRGPFLKLEDLETAGKQLVVVPIEKESGIVRDGSRHNQILLQRFDTSDLMPDTLANSGDGAVAYSAICTHNGCPVTAWDRDAQTFMCPCHQSQFNPKNAASVVEGPAPRELPALPLRVENGEIVVADAFTARVGHGRKGS
ncbi:QcrA and Rieske domain-containing protein [Algihabitans albus]|uniref:QcrA and Rieske domain-containing protein n=1 Tax=Algihabitans albus TaxID=2164067 RepID=UPI000E5D402B|nr:Rieske (2Fe-2S) protein [Algihabitans albus]